jgi:hypothetical protein
MPSQNDNGGRRGPWGGGAKPGSDLGDLVRQGQDRVQQIMPSGGLRPAIVLAVIALVGLGAWTAYYTVPLSLSCNVSESISRLFRRDYRRRAGDIRQRLRVVLRMPFEPVGTVKPRRFIAPHPLMIPGFVDKLSAARWLFGFRIAISLEGPALRAHRRNAPYSLPDWLLPRNQTDRVTLPRKGKLPCGEFPRCIFLAEGGDVSLQPKMSIEVGVHHSHTTPSYGDGFIVSRSNRGALGMNIDLNVRSNISARACPSSPHRHRADKTRPNIPANSGNR